ncbi:phospho-N-acetylmuramoyl-pentapeptide-transferase [Peptoniphilus raoultii]|uniref:phospho-N-acetylmuramoyl-pentapeptide- transferase n=1 Tax=Peptoniphilus raoultii TaxID=1776387 RepID=UPI0008D97D83|nr:phospho-N-acetylmuramoyl-pentapeptide-transferase [Peptoniphilus raoultii]
MSNILIIFLALVISLIAGKFFIPLLRRIKAGQSIREDGPKSHMIKTGTPTIGGLIFLTSMLITNLIFNKINLTLVLLIFATFAFGLVGFIDDYIKVVKKRNLGLTAIQKLSLQILVSLVLIFFQYYSSSLENHVYVPIIKKFISFGVFYIPFILFVIVGTVNSVNITDGLDGLSSGVTIICLGFFAICAYKFNNMEIFKFSIILIGALLGFLYFNKYPAKVFMGDTGSLALGGAVSAIAVLLNIPLILPVAGGIYFIETLSVIIQVISFKTRGKRVFLMSPLHHHFEQKGWKEQKVVWTFYLAEGIFCLISYLILF